VRGRTRERHLSRAGAGPACRAHPSGRRRRMMRTYGALVCGCTLLFAAAGAARADDESVFQACCWRCRPTVAAYAPPCGCCPTVTAYYAPRRCGPIRRLLGLCCPAVSFRVSCAPPPVVCGPTCPPSAGPAIVTVPPAPAPVPLPLTPNTRSYFGNTAPPPPAPVAESSYRPRRVPGRNLPPVLTPPLPPPPVRLDRIVSKPGTSERGAVQAVPATRIRTPDLP
jgi:hypothetical protein